MTQTATHTIVFRAGNHDQPLAADAAEQVLYRLRLSASNRITTNLLEQLEAAFDDGETVELDQTTAALMVSLLRGLQGDPGYRQLSAMCRAFVTDELRWWW
jgi:hypothetical protein